VILRTAKPTKILYHLVIILARITTVNETVISIPCKLKNPARLASKTPMPNGKNVITPKMIDASLKIQPYCLQKRLFLVVKMLLRLK